MNLSFVKLAIENSENALSMDEEASVYFNIIGYLSKVPTNLFYLACTNNTCKKKVTEGTDGFECIKCNLTVRRPKPRFIGNLNF